jgi:hypothetical protein
MVLLPSGTGIKIAADSIGHLKVMYCINDFNLVDGANQSHTIISPQRALLLGEIFG